MLQAMKELGRNIEAKNDIGRTPAHLAAWQVKESAFRTLKELGCNTPMPRELRQLIPPMMFPRSQGPLSPLKAKALKQLVVWDGRVIGVARMT